MRHTQPSEVKILLHDNLRHGSFISSVAAGHTNQKEARWYFHSSSSKAHTLSFFYNLYFICIFRPQGEERNPAIAMKSHSRMLLCVLLHWGSGRFITSLCHCAFYDLHWSSRCTTIIMPSTLSSRHFSPPPMPRDMDRETSDSHLLLCLLPVDSHWEKIWLTTAVRSHVERKKTHTCVFFIKRYFSDSALNSYNLVRLTMDIVKHGSNLMQQNQRSHLFFSHKLLFFSQKTGIYITHNAPAQTYIAMCYARDYLLCQIVGCIEGNIGSTNGNWLENGKHFQKTTWQLIAQIICLSLSSTG